MRVVGPVDFSEQLVIESRINVQFSQASGNDLRVPDTMQRERSPLEMNRVAVSAFVVRQ